MPVKSEAQRRFLWANKPELAKKWAEKYGMPKDLPYKKGQKKQTAVDKKVSEAIGKYKKRTGKKALSREEMKGIVKRTLRRLKKKV